MLLIGAPLKVVASGLTIVAFWAVAIAGWTSIWGFAGRRGSLYLIRGNLGRTGLANARPKTQHFRTLGPAASDFRRTGTQAR